MYDKIADDLLDYADEIKENYYIARDLEVPTSKEINSSTLEYMSSRSDIHELHNLITLCIYHIEEYINNNNTLTEGDKSLLGEISNDLNKKLGFINQTIKNKAEI
jgi:predicted DNA-binding ArsR family transcriptional regulator